MRSTIIAVVAATLVGCAGQADSSDGLDPGGAPEILQVLVRERVTVTDDEGDERIELRSRLAFGDHDDIDRDADDREVTAAVARDGQRVRVVFDELLRGNTLEEVPCADGTWSRLRYGIGEAARIGAERKARCRRRTLCTSRRRNAAIGGEARRIVDAISKAVH